MTKQEEERKRDMPKAEKEFKQPNCTCMYSCNNGLQFSTFSLPMRSLLELRLFWIWNISVGATDVASLVCSWLWKQREPSALMYISVVCMRMWVCWATNVLSGIYYIFHIFPFFLHRMMIIIHTVVSKSLRPHWKFEKVWDWEDFWKKHLNAHQSHIIWSKT